MNGWKTWVAVVLIGAGLIHIAAIWILPRVIMAKALRATVDRAGGVNRVLHPPQATAEVRRVVRPSPDLLYSACVVDVSGGPVRITAPTSEPYSSIAVFASNTDNIFVLNDLEAKADVIEVVVAGDGQRVLPGVQFARLPSQRGLALIRRAIRNEQHVGELRQLQQQEECKPVQ